MKLTKTANAVALASLLTVGLSAQAAINTSGSVALTSDYLFRGISQTSESMAVQGSISVADSSGVYFTTWASSLSSNATTGANDNGGIEVDTLLGYAGSTDAFSYDVGVMRYNYPQDNTAPGGGGNIAYNEVYASVSAAGAKLGAAYSDDYFGETGKFYYLYADYSVELTEKVSAFAHVGWNKFERNGGFLGGSSDDYVDYKVALSTEVSGLGVELAYAGADSIASAPNAYGDYAEGRAILTVSKSF